ncbi:hypothetical protein DH2020_003390 [Rehmannia glutinosa]|uniref:WRKY domain-containing protein n=1 Tax=Rehmannia glutinosa TaxID=99300 RepID=A0ABR0XLL0_REHGL
MTVKEERTIKFSTDEAKETLITEGMKEDINLKTAKVKMDEVREENERLKLTLSQMMKDYNSLKMQFNDIIQEDDQLKKSTNLAPMAASDGDHESDFVSLSLGRFSGEFKREEKKNIYNESKNQENSKLDGLKLGLDWKFQLGDNSIEVSKNLRPESSSDESKEEGNKELRASHDDKSAKISRSGDDEILQQNPLKKPRVSVRAVCNTQTMNDGCQWRKYGQKIAKANPCPRAYYRCTVSSSCPVRKQVQRCIDDMTILITTYEGTHNHPLPPSATTMASATSAAVAMLNCGSTSSPPRHDVSATSSTSPNPFGFNSISSNSLTTSHFPRAYTISSQSHPTVILDLTAPNPHNKFSSTLFSATHSFPTSLNFSSFGPNYPRTKNVVATPYSQLFQYKNIHPSQKQTADDDQKIGAATKAITTDSNFQSALAAAITSFVGTNNDQRRNSGLNYLPSFLKSSMTNGSIGCVTGFLNRFPQSVDPQHKYLTDFPPLTLSLSKSQAMSLADQGEQMKVMSFEI